MSLIETVYADLIYEPPPPVTASFTEQFNAIVPLSENGIDRRLRFIWGMDATEYCGGQMERIYGDTDHTPSKYVGRARWVLEFWEPPSSYDRNEWTFKERLLGPFPENGRYRFAAYHTGPDDGYLPLDDSALLYVKQWRYWQHQGPQVSLDAMILDKMRTKQQREKERQDRIDHAIRQAVDDAIHIKDTAPVSSFPAAIMQR